MLILLVLLILAGIGVKNWIFTEAAAVVPAENAVPKVEMASPLEEEVPLTITTAAAETQTIPAPAIVTTIPAAPATVATNVVTVSPGDTLWAIAATTWGDSYWWTVIYAENRPELSRLNPDLIDIGITLRIPVLARSVNNPVAAELRLKANAYRIVADDYQKLNNPRAAEYATVTARGFNK